MSYDAIEVSRHIINYSIKNRYELSNLKLQKLLYFVQAQFLIEKNEPCFRDKIEAWDFGPVVPSVYREYVKYGSCNLPEIRYVRRTTGFDSLGEKVTAVPFKDMVISGEDKNHIDFVVDLFAGYSSVKLVQITQEQTPWIEAFRSGKHNEITVEAVREYFLKKEHC